MKVLALDQSSNISGWAYFDGENLVKYDILDVSKCGKAMERMSMIVQWIDWFVLNHEIDLMIFEDVVLQNEAKYKQTNEYKESHADEDAVDNIITFQTLTKLLGILEYYCNSKKIKYKIIKPSEWRSACGISGTKRQIVKQGAIDFVKKKWGLDVKEDVNEAICIGWSEVQPKNVKAWGNFIN